MTIDIDYNALTVGKQWSKTMTDVRKTMTDVSDATSATVNYLKSKGFVYNSNKYRKEPNGEYVHPIGVRVELWDKLWTNRVEVTFEGPTIERPRVVKYGIDTLNALFNRTQRILLAAAKDHARRQKDTNEREAKRNKIVDAVRDFGTVTLVPRDDYSYAVKVEYHGRKVNVHLISDELVVLVSIGALDESISLDKWVKIIDVVTTP